MDASSPPVVPPPSRLPRAGRRLLAGLGLAGLTAALVAAVPAVAGTSWPAVTRLAAGTDLTWLPWLAAVWVAGLGAYAVVQTAALPGLSAGRAVALTLGGSAVGNLVPLGGAASMGVCAAMARRWGFGPSRFGAYLTVTTLWSSASRVVLGAAALAWWALARPGGPPLADPVAVLLPAVAVLAALGAVVASEPACRAVAGTAGRVVDRGAGLLGRASGGRRGRWPDVVAATRAEALAANRTAWPRVVAGLLLHNALLVLLLDGCLRAVGHPAPLVAVCAAVGLERLLTAVPVTPGGSGVAELGLVAVLAAGTAPAAAPAAAAGALLYRVFTYLLEVPVGAPLALTQLARPGRPALAARAAGGAA
ncbi:lysylphosphatidylglycerol synthase domain-containing protein [Kineosporia sp. R_H_3]|uniref:lysylphosphatidylglycerol synthase domain-containing protein n=1 Tax=Kineosporia sp. R_H_3 TaxID=1961848 RepID=UPI0013045432|nr:lysylphosphatidylglycerol synthase domain-containing protein [Kineosporia sp. R_H_3]